MWSNTLRHRGRREGFLDRLGEENKGIQRETFRLCELVETRDQGGGWTMQGHG